MDILAVQQRLIDSGYQFIEHIYNDELSKKGRNCYVTITSSKDNSFSSEYSSNKRNCIHWDTIHSWGRFDRMECWKLIAEWLDKKEDNE